MYNARLLEFEEDIFKKLLRKGQIPLFYANEEKPLSLFKHESIAGLCDPKGLIFGLMPHPEAFLFKATDRFHHRVKKADPVKKGWGQQIFDNIVYYLERS